MSASITTPGGIERLRWITIRGGLKLEEMGMKRRGQSCRQIVLKASGLKPGTSYADLIAWCDQTIKEFS